MYFSFRRVVPILALFVVVALAAVPASAGGLKVFGAYLDSSDVGAFTGAGVRYSSSDTLGWEFGATAYLEGDDFDFGELDFDSDSIDNTALDFGFLVSINELFYFTGGVSYFMFDADYGDVDDEWGFYATLGATIGGDTFRFFIEGMYRDVSATITYDDFELIEDDVKLDIGGFGVNAGLEWRF
ncbi:MAG: hypothetical protein DRJ61_00835 [Acidobacteria bacterium]|nr:MAG: hypothetical protein DRJ61_00835 [Acidobacteriota bacterium]